MAGKKKFVEKQPQCLRHQEDLRIELLSAVEAALKLQAKDDRRPIVLDLSVRLYAGDRVRAEMPLLQAVDSINNGLWWDVDAYWGDANSLALLDEIGKEVNA